MANYERTPSEPHDPRRYDLGYVSPETKAQIADAVYGIGKGHEDAWTQYMRGGNAVGEHDVPPVAPHDDVANLYNHGHEGLEHKPSAQ